jgi:hypothetical protein
MAGLQWIIRAQAERQMRCSDRIVLHSVHLWEQFHNGQRRLGKPRRIDEIGLGLSVNRSSPGVAPVPVLLMAWARQPPVCAAGLL